MPPLKAPVIKLPDLEHFRLSDPEKKGVMCTECKRVHWNAASVKKCKCGDTDPDHRINVSSADFNKYSGRFIQDDVKRWLSDA